MREDIKLMAFLVLTVVDYFGVGGGYVHKNTLDKNV